MLAMAQCPLALLGLGEELVDALARAQQHVLAEYAGSTREEVQTIQTKISADNAQATQPRIAHIVSRL